MTINDVHCHFFSERFFEMLSQGLPRFSGAHPARQVTVFLGWDDPGSPSDLAGRWVEELDQSKVNRAALIASLPGDEDSVAQAVACHPERFVGFFMANPLSADEPQRVEMALREKGLRAVCLFPAMHGHRIDDPAARQIFEVAASVPGVAVFVHCGALKVGVRNKLGLPSDFDIRNGNPLDLIPVALDHPDLPILIPHFGAGFLRETLMAVDLCPNILLDTSSSNNWIRYVPSLTLDQVFESALRVAGAARILFGSDSSYFPRGWNSQILESQKDCLQRLQVSEADQEKIIGGNFDWLFPAGSRATQAGRLKTQPSAQRESVS